MNLLSIVESAPVRYEDCIPGLRISRGEGRAITVHGIYKNAHGADGIEFICSDGLIWGTSRQNFEHDRYWVVS